MAKHSPREVAAWVMNVGGTGATDEEFAEFFVYLERMREDRKFQIKTPGDMLINTERLSDWVDGSLQEIIYGNEGDDPVCWWKKGGK